jgi:RimJ/RimL family protein N-acetyltransferase
MAPGAIVHLPNGQNLTVTPVFGGLYFKSNDLSSHHASPFPPGWTVVLNSEDDEEDFEPSPRELLRDIEATKPHSAPVSRPTTPAPAPKRHMVHRFRKPSLQNDHLFISSISQPSSNDFKPASSPTRQIAMMLWATLWWYFHQPEPHLHIQSKATERTAEAGKPKGSWRININREGVFKSKVILPKLERMGLVASEESAVGADLDDRAGEGWQKMFVSRRAFWQLDARIYLFTMAPSLGSPLTSTTPQHSRPGSPSRQGDPDRHDGPVGASGAGVFAPSRSPGPFHSASHLPTYYPPLPPQYVMTNGILHPMRAKPPRQGETFYTRYIPSVGQYLSFRVASTSHSPQVYKGPVAAAPLVSQVKTSVSEPIIPTIANLHMESCDPDLLHKWMNEPRVAEFWGEQGPQAHQEEFLKKGLRSRHSFPAIGCWDGKPFGYFEIYWVKEDALGKYTDCGNYDRGIHCLVGEQEFRGPSRVKIWLTALVHYCWLADNRTETVMMEPRVDNQKYANIYPSSGRKC